MLWIDVASRSINRAYLNGSEKMTLIDSDMRTPGECQLQCMQYLFLCGLIDELIHYNHTWYAIQQSVSLQTNRGVHAL